MRTLRYALRRALSPHILSAYHYFLAYLGAILYRFPSRRIAIVGITGTNGKSSTVEFLNAILEEAGRSTALSSSIRWKIAGASGPAGGRSMPGRFFLQRLLRRAIEAKCDAALIEMTSEGARQYRHRAIDLDCLVFLNLAPEHIESHGSLAAYADAKYELGRQLVRSHKRPRIMIANADDTQGTRYLTLPVEKPVGFAVSQSAHGSDAHGGWFDFDDAHINVRVPGAFYIQNALAAATAARALGIDTAAIKRGIERIAEIPGRMQRVDAGQQFGVLVDYALTPDALEALYETYGDAEKICVFGSAGGGRDTWKRPVLGEIADRHCTHVILTNDVAYDEPPEHIIDDIARGMKKIPEKIPDRRLAIRRAIELARDHADPARVMVLITGMGIDAEITGANGQTRPWSDIDVARAELRRACADGRYTEAHV